MASIKDVSYTPKPQLPPKGVTPWLKFKTDRNLSKLDDYSKVKAYGNYLKKSNVPDDVRANLLLGLEEGFKFQPTLGGSDQANYKTYIKDMGVADTQYMREHFHKGITPKIGKSKGYSRSWMNKLQPPIDAYMARPQLAHKSSKSVGKGKDKDRFGFGTRKS